MPRVTRGSEATQEIWTISEKQETLVVKKLLGLELVDLNSKPNLPTLGPERVT